MKIKLWRLKDTNNWRDFQEELLERIGGVESGWKGYCTVFMEAAKEFCGEATGQTQKDVVEGGRRKTGNSREEEGV